MLKGLDFTGTSTFTEEDIIDSLAAYILKMKGTSKLKDTFRFYIYNNQMKIIVLTQLFRVFAKSVEKPYETPADMLVSEKDKEEEKERLKQYRAHSKELSSTLLAIFVEFIYENLENNPIREFILENLGPFIKKKLVSFEPYFLDYLKKMLEFIGLNNSLNLFDMNFMLMVINGSVFDVKKSMAILDSLVNLFFLSIPQARFLLMCINTIMNKIPKHEAVVLYHQVLIKFCLDTTRIALNRYITLEKKRRRPLGFLKTIKIDAKDKSLNRNAKEILGEFQLAQRRALIVELIKCFYWLGIEPVNLELKGLLVFANLMYKNHIKEKDLGLKKLPNSKAICSILTFYGDPDEIVEKEELDAEFKLMSGQNFKNLSMTVVYIDPSHQMTL